MNVRTQGTQKESQVLTIDGFRKNGAVLHYTLEYDTLSPEETLRNFVAKIRSMLSKYEGNKNRIDEIETEIVDIEHYIEIGNFQNVTNGYRLYRKLAELRRERRACKNENDLLWPIYEYFHATTVLDKLTNVQGEVSKAKFAIDGRYYTTRTSVLNEYLNKDEKPSVRLALDSEDLSEVL